MDLPRFLFTIPELAVRWNCQEDDIINLAVARKIFLSVNMTNCAAGLPHHPPLPISGWWNLGKPGEIAQLLAGQQSIYASWFLDPSDEEKYRRFKIEKDSFSSFEFYRRDVVVLGKYVEIFEKDNADLLKNLNSKDKLMVEVKENGSLASMLTPAAQEFYHIRGIKQAAAILGVTEKTTQSYLKGDLPCLKRVGKKVEYLFNEEEIRTWQENHGRSKALKLQENLKK